MATVTRYSVAKTQDSCSSPSTTLGSAVYSETNDLRDAYHYGTSVGGDVSDGPAEDTTQLLPTS
jgi:hypothetical protein